MTSRRFGLAALFLVAAVAAACGDSDTPSTVGAEPATSEAAATAQPGEVATADATTEAAAITGVTDACGGRLQLFEPFLDTVSVACDDEYLYVDADGLSEHSMMVGITAWNQQVPLPQPYADGNAWRIPLEPVEAATATPTNGQGAVAMALNGVPIFDPTQQDGVYAEQRDPYLIGELDTCGGHAGRGDDYHYHAGPICLVEQLAADGEPIGFALDGYAILGFRDVGGEAPSDLDACGGHEDDALGYHYHLTETAPYVLGCYHGVVDISIQPQAHPVRQDGTPIAVEITSYEVAADGTSALEYLDEGTLRSVSWLELDDGCFQFTYVDPPLGSPGVGTETVCRADRPQPPA